MSDLWRVEVGDCLEVLKGMESGSVHCCVTSPPYFGLRDYGTGQWEGGDSDCKHEVRQNHNAAASSTLLGSKKTVHHAQEGFRETCPRCGARRIDRQIGLESSPTEYIAALVRVFGEVRRVLRDDGTLWLNIGSCYASTPPGCKGVSKSSGLNGADTSTAYRETLENSVGQKRSSIVAGGDEPFALREDLTPDELVYVLSELAAHFRNGDEVP